MVLSAQIQTFGGAKSFVRRHDVVARSMVELHRPESRLLYFVVIGWPIGVAGGVLLLLLLLPIRRPVTLRAIA